MLTFLMQIRESSDDLNFKILCGMDPSSGLIHQVDQLAGSTKRTRAGWIHKRGQQWLDPLSSDWMT